MKDRLNNTNGIYSIIAFLFEIFAILFLIARITYFTSSISENAIIQCGLVLFLIILFVLIVAGWEKFELIGSKIQSVVRNTSCKSMVVCIILCSLIVRVGLCFLLQIDSIHHPDSEMYWSFIQQLTNNGHIVENADYANSYNYTVSYAMFFLPFTKIFGAKSIVMMNAYLCVLFSIGSYFLFDTIKYYVGKNYAFVSVMVWTFLPIGALEPLFLAHEHSLVFLHIIAIWFLFRVLPSCNKIVLKFLSLFAGVLVLAYAALINRFAIISFIAFLIVLFIKLVINNFSIKNLMKILVVVVSFVLIFSCVKTIRADLVRRVVDDSPSVVTKGYSVPYGWPLYVGLNYESKGEWNAEDKERYYKYKEFDNKDDAQKHQINLIKERVNEYLDKPFKLVKHANDKLEIISYGFNPLNYDMGNSINSFIYHGADGLIHKAMTGLFALINILMALLLVLSVRIKKPNDSIITNYFRLFVMGTCGILLFTEVTPKYSSHLLFVLIALMVLGIKNANYNVKRIKNKCKKL